MIHKKLTVKGRWGQTLWSLVSLTEKYSFYYSPFILVSKISGPCSWSFHTFPFPCFMLAFFWRPFWHFYLLLSRLVVVPPATRQRKVKVEKRRREFTMLLQYKSLHVTTFTNPCNKFEKSFANLTKHSSTRQWSKKGEGREKVERFYSSDCNVQCFSKKISLRWTRGVFKGRQCTRYPKKTDFQNAVGATLHQ